MRISEKTNTNRRNEPRIPDKINSSSEFLKCEVGKTKENTRTE